MLENLVDGLATVDKMIDKSSSIQHSNLFFLGLTGHSRKIYIFTKVINNINNLKKCFRFYFLWISNKK